MIHSLKMVNWRSHEETAINFSPATNLLIGSIGSGKTSCLDAICFALFGTFPSLRTRRVSLEDTLTAAPGIDRGVIELVFSADGKRYTVTRILSAKGTEAFLRGENGRLLEGPQPIRTTEAVSRILRLDYDLFSRVIYGEQNRLDYFLTLPKGERKTQLDEALGIAAFETARSTASTVVSRLRVEKGAMDQFLAGVDLPTLEKELNKLRSEVGELEDREKALENKRLRLNEEVETLKKNIEGLESVKKIYNELSEELVKAESEAQSLATSASTIMPSGFDSFSREQCTSFLEQCARALQERADLEEEFSRHSLDFERLKGEVAAVEKSIAAANVQKLNYELPQLEAAAKQLEEVRGEFLEAAKKTEASQRSLSLLQSELKEISTALANSSAKTIELSSLQVKFTSLSTLESKVAEQRQRRLNLEKLISAKLDSIEKLEKIISLLAAAEAHCPTCEQPLAKEAAEKLLQVRKELLAAEIKFAKQIEQDLESIKAELGSIEEALQKWVELLPLELQNADLNKREEAFSKVIASTKLEFEAASTVLRSCQVKISALQVKAERLEVVRGELVQVEKSQSRLAMLSEDLSHLQSELEKKALALSAFEKREELEAKLTRARDALKAFDMLERRSAALARAAGLSAKLSSISFDTNAIVDYNYKLNSSSSQLEGCTVSLQHTGRSVMEKKELLVKLETQHAKLSEIRAGLEAVTSGIQNVQIFQNSLVETQATLRMELISAVNETMAELWPSIYPYRDYRSVRIVPTEDDYLLQLLDASGNWKAIERASGGEKTCAALCLRVALAMVLVPNLNWLVLDEPTHNLDAQAVSLLARALHDTLPTIVKQTFVVTHEDALKEGASGSVHVFHRDKDKGGFTVVETL